MMLRSWPHFTVTLSFAFALPNFTQSCYGLSQPPGGFCPAGSSLAPAILIISSHVLYLTELLQAPDEEVERLQQEKEKLQEELQEARAETTQREKVTLRHECSSAGLGSNPNPNQHK